ncbi:sporulation integral membrane protein YtvI [Falsibacillus albus]|uniref:Sporulation integral membrane protein YtvI n=1 Tax=Falsibacillus albus TaxID=2478915 RepID=A0A3L7K069_9BACI|nr:sporulation integral membrane protein YtvI [Falsibacillus albus]RLQ95864.1 sporulation integral membrane protein YtvI [Falsibacillus albus]
MSAIFKKKYLIFILLLIISALFIYFVLPVSIPLIVAIVTALFLDPLVRLVVNKFNRKRHFAVMIVFITFTLLMGLAAFFITTKVVTEAVKLVQDAPKYVSQMNDLWSNYEGHFSSASQDLPKELVDTVSNEIQTNLESSKKKLFNYLNFEKVSTFLSYIPNFLVSFLVYLIALFLFMLELPNIKKAIYSHLHERTADKVNFMTSRLSYVVFGFLKAQFLVSIIIFIVSMIGLLIITPDIAVVMSLIIWIIDFIPLIGSIVILGPWALFHLLTGDISLGSQLAILAIILLIIRRTVEPKVMGTHIGLSPLSTLIAMFLGLKLLGLFGFIIGPLLLIVFNSAKEAGIIKWNFKI